MDVLLDAIQDGAVVSQQQTVRAPTAALQGVGLAGGSGEDVETGGSGFGVWIGHVYGGLRKDEGGGDCGDERSWWWRWW